MKKNILFLLVDALRADKCWGTNKTAKTPTIDSLQKRGTTFTQAIATTTTTTPSVASIFTGLYPFAHGLRSFLGYKLRNNITTLAEILKENGYHTYAEVTGPLLTETGLDAEFDNYNVRNPKENVYSCWFDELLTKFENKEFKEPWFVFIHFWELHIPRAVPSHYDHEKYGTNKYERALSALDSRIGRLLEYINQSDIILFHADHGERIPETRTAELIYPLINRAVHILQRAQIKKFKNRDRFFLLGHGFHVYEYLIRVPLICVGENVFPEKRIPHQVRQIDIFPTLVDTLGLESNTTYTVHGRSVLPLIKGRSLKDVPAYCEAVGDVSFDKSMWLAGLRTPQYKYIYGPYSDSIPEELYNLENDPHEQRNIVKEKPEIAKKLRNEIKKISSEHQESKKLKQAINKLKIKGKI
ncbi:MAG: sulfatase-like hydrolase/transferase [Candidatus Methanofastidiosia archaeon]|jgi:arylsulfatase A-like enzyme